MGSQDEDTYYGYRVKLYIISLASQTVEVAPNLGQLAYDLILLSEGFSYLRWVVSGSSIIWQSLLFDFFAWLVS